MRLMSNIGTAMFFVGLWGLTAVASREQDAVTTLLAILLILAVVLGSAAIYLKVFYAFPHLFHYNYNGKIIKFTNPYFHRAFAMLNPEMVAPKERSLEVK